MIQHSQSPGPVGVSDGAVTHLKNLCYPSKVMLWWHDDP